MIDHLILNDFRAAAGKFELPFESKKRLTLIFGENGTGKTTIADALECLGSETAGSLAEKSGAKPKEHLPTINKSSDDLSVEAHVNQTNGVAAQKWILKLGKKGLMCSPQPKPKIKVLRRLHIQKISDATPGDRYERLKEFLDFRNIVSSEAALAEAAKEAKTHFNRATEQLGTLEESLKASWKAQGSPKDTFENWLVSRKDTEALVTDDRSTAAKKLSASIQNLNANFEPIGVAAESVKVGLRACENDKQLSSSTSAANSNGEIAKLLRQVSEFLAKPKSNSDCPVCEQAVDFSLAEKVNARLAGMAKEEALARQSAANLKAYESAKTGYDQRVSTFVQLSKSLSIELQKNNLKLDISLLPKSTIEGLNNAEGILDFGLAAKQTLDAIAEGAQAEKILAPQVEQLHELRVESKLLEKIAQRMDLALKIARTARLRSTQLVLDGIVDECNRLYACIHPNELKAISKMELDPNKRASLTQSANFEGHSDVPPQAYLSESHLDTLAFCFWLAAAKLDVQCNQLTVVLDDVFSTVDEQHTERIARLLIDECKGFFRVILLTHQRLWQKTLRNVGCVQSIELGDWSLEKGISKSEAIPLTEQLEMALKQQPFDRQIVASKVGVLIEGILNKLTLHYECSLPRKDKYSLGELICACSDLMKKFRIERQVDDVFVALEWAGSWETVKKLAYIRNEVGGHDNPDGEGIPNNLVLDFGNAALEFARAVTCDKCRLIVKKPAGPHYECSCKTHRMFPLKLK
jgi:energy-coupling factor transporter ATP-binding protein EcfA2